MAEELELKYSIEDASAVEAWLDGAFPPQSDQRWRTLSITDRYFDAADGAISGAGYGARLRRTGRRTTLTLKTDIEVAGALHRRLELEGRATEELSPEAWPHSEARDRLVEIVGLRRLIERFVVRQRRRERELSVGGAELVASIDTGVVLAAGIEAGRIFQFELELRRGRRAVMQRIAAAVENSELGRPESESKLATAARMAAAASRVTAEDLFAEAGRRVLRRHLVRMLDREIGTLSGDALALKQMRVATRRLRATWRVFDDAFKASAPRRFLGQLRRIGQALGAVRDLDVLLASLPEDPALIPLAEDWRERRQAAFDELLGFLRSKRYSRFVDDMLDFAATPGAGAAKRLAAAPVADLAPTALRAALDRVLTAGAAAAGAAAAGTEDVEAWHALRIEGRRLRYSVEAFADVLAERPARDILRRMTRLQDQLGAMQDAVVAIEAASAWLGESESEPAEATRAAVGAYVAKRQAQIASSRAGFAGAWRGVSGVTFERLLERALASMGVEKR